MVFVDEVALRQHPQVSINPEQVSLIVHLHIFVINLTHF
jgi:hypothetical protein